MYHVLLTNRYLTTRVIPLIAVAAVALCVALVIVVVSVMTGFLNMVKESGKGIVGDVVITYSVTGLPYYERLIDRLEAMPEVAAAAPIVDGWGLLRMPYPPGEEKQSVTVQFWAVDAESYAQVTDYADTLYWKPPTESELAEMSEDDFRRLLLDSPDLAKNHLDLESLRQQGLTLRREMPDGTMVPGVVLGMHVSAGNERQSDGSYRPVLGPIGYWWMPQFEVVLTTVPVKGLGTAGALDAKREVLQVVNEFMSGVFMIDDTRIIIPLEVGQRLLNLDEARFVDEEGEETGFVDPKRATQILVRAADGITPDELRPLVSDAYHEYWRELHDDQNVDPSTYPPPEGAGVIVQTWLQQQAQFIAPIEKERELMRVLFSLIYLVCAGLVLSIFWAIVYEKTRDIGILRSVGASRMGISVIFLRYGAIIGVAGSVVGLGLAYLIVHNINAIHTAMGEPAPRAAWITMFCLAGATFLITIWRSLRGLLLPVVLWALLTIVVVGLGVGLMFHKGTLIWDPSVYYFSEIPNEMDPWTATTTMIGAVVFSVLGAFFPAAKAADTDPVRALRYE